MNRAQSVAAKPMAIRRAALLQDVEESARQVATDYGVSAPIADQLACAIAAQLAEDWAGQNITIPSDYLYRLGERDMQIWREHVAGVPVPALAKRYGIFERAIRKVLKRAKLRAEAPQQDLFSTDSVGARVSGPAA
jgi:Mor family transcriptional regulator